MDLKKAGCKKQGHCYSKREEAAWPLLFFGPDLFQGRKPTHVFKTRIVGADWLGQVLQRASILILFFVLIFTEGGGIDYVVSVWQHFLHLQKQA